MAIGLEAAVGYFYQSPSGTVAYKPVSGVDNLDLESDMGYDSEWQATGRLKIDVPILPNIYLMATPMKFDGQGQKNVSFKFGDQTFNASVDFSSEVQLDHYDVALYYGIPFLGMATLGKVNAEVGLNLRIIDFSAKVEQPTLGRSESVSKTIPVPMIYAGVQLKPISLIAIEAEGRGIAYNSHSYYDLIGRLKVKPFGPVFVAGGYRYEKIKIEDISDIYTDVEFSGPFVEVGVSF
ncbi:MAG: TIGR04219 family outer membrane beta-barrel protein [Nitrospirae bacterium]|nr:MAG: TIGR04219 family outer membrane beta-barrel protein [Nitrospirota bacterium]